MKSKRCLPTYLVPPAKDVTFDIVTSSLVFDEDSNSYVRVSKVVPLDSFLRSSAELSVRDFDLQNLVLSGVNPELTDVRLIQSAICNVDSVVNSINS